MWSIKTFGRFDNVISKNENESNRSTLSVTLTSTLNITAKSLNPKFIL